MSPRPVIALLTDFGLSDHYVGVMKGVIAGICPDALVIDITHDVPPQDIRAAAFELEASWRYFPVGAIFVVVVDRGVGTARRGIAARIGDRYFVGPDNGVFDLVVTAQAGAFAMELQNPKYRRPRVSGTFAGRDRFAPAAAWLATGADLADFGNGVVLGPHLKWPTPVVTDEAVAGEVAHIDRFGNLITNIDRRIWPAILDIAEDQVGDNPPVRLVRTYADAFSGELVALFGSTDRLELAVTSGSAARQLGVRRGAPVHVTRRA
jgi:hypothetical protein